MRRACATDALRGGRALNASKYSAAVTSNGVLQAGVWCDGSEQATQQLRQIAGTLAPRPRKKQRRTSVTGKSCVSCGRPLHKWTRDHDEIPAGHVMHYARQYCVNCRAAYNEHLEEWKNDHPDQVATHMYSRKEIDRKRHAPETLPGRIYTARRKGDAAKVARLIAEAEELGVPVPR